MDSTDRSETVYTFHITPSTDTARTWIADGAEKPALLRGTLAQGRDLARLLDAPIDLLFGTGYTAFHVKRDGKLPCEDGPDEAAPNILDPTHLRTTAIAAEAAGFAAFDGGKNDGGSCNFDCAVLHLPTSWREQVLAALDGTNLRTYVDEWMCSPGETAFHVSSERTGGQGFARTRAAEAIQNAFKAAGYPGLTYYQVD